jgi:hypothetical protein
LAKVAVQCSADTFVVNQSWFSASTFVVKIATFAKPETVKHNIFFAKQKLRFAECGARIFKKSYNQ